jgi:hypothetical protein
MKKDEVVVGSTYSAKVGARTLDVRIDGENARGGWNATGVDSGKPVRIKDARLLRGPADADDGGRRVEPADEAGDAAAGGDLVPATKPGTEKRGGKKARAAKVPKKPAKGKEPKAMSCLDAAAAVLKARGEPMRCKEMVEAMKDKGLWTTTAPTPEATLYSAILREISNKKSEARFRKTERGHFALNTK